jgi:hypothetical protein
MQQCYSCLWSCALWSCVYQIKRIFYSNTLPSCALPCLSLSDMIEQYLERHTRTANHSTINHTAILTTGEWTQIRSNGISGGRQSLSRRPTGWQGIFPSFFGICPEKNENNWSGDWSNLAKEKDTIWKERFKWFLMSPFLLCACLVQHWSENIWEPCVYSTNFFLGITPLRLPIQVWSTWSKFGNGLGVWVHPSSVGLVGISLVDLSRHQMSDSNISRCWLLLSHSIMDLVNIYSRNTFKY